MIKKISCVFMAFLLLFSAAACQKISPAKTDSSGSLTKQATEGSFTEDLSTTESIEESSSLPTAEDEVSEESQNENQPETSSEERDEVGLHLTDGLLLKYLTDGKLIYLIATNSQGFSVSAGPPYQIYELTNLSKEQELQLASFRSGQKVQMTYIIAKKDMNPLFVQPTEIIDLDSDSNTPSMALNHLSLFRFMAEMGYIHLIDYDAFPTFLLMMPISVWQDHPVTYEYSEDGRTIDVVYALKRDGEEETFKFKLATFSLLYSGDEPGGDIGYANILLKQDGPDYLYLGLPRYAFDYIAGNHDFYFCPEEGNWDNKVKVTLTDEELKTLIYLQTGYDNSEDYDALRKAYSDAQKKDDTKAMSEASHHVFAVDEWFKKISEEHISINGLKPLY